MKQEQSARDAVDCTGAMDRLFDLLDEELDDATVERVKKHMGGCKHCYDRADFERRFLAAVATVRAEGPMPGGLRERVVAALRAEGWEC